MKVIEGGPSDQEIIRRIATAVIAQWNGFDQMTKDGLLREACLAIDPVSRTTSKHEQILAFIRKHQEPPPRSPALPST
jgi:hypothetical protein